MSDIKFKFDYSNETNMLYIEGTKELCDKNYVCSARGSLCDINLQETLDRIRMSLQDKIHFTFNNGKDIGIKLDGDYYNTCEETEEDTIECKMNKLEKLISALDCKINELIK